MESFTLLTHLSQNYTMTKLSCLSNELTHSKSVTLVGERLFSTHTNPCATAEVITRATTGQRGQEEPVFPFQNRLESVHMGPDTIPEQYASEPDPGNANRKIGILRRV